MNKKIFFKSPEHEKLVLRLIEARRDSGLDQREVAKILGKSQSFISKIEAGHSHIDVIYFYKMTIIYIKIYLFILNSYNLKEEKVFNSCFIY